MKARHFDITLSVTPNRWDLAASMLILGLFVLAARGIHGMHEPIAVLQNMPVSLNPHRLPGYALRTVLRMAAAIIASLLFTFTYGTLAAKSRRAGMILVPLLDVLQSVPVLGFISFTVVFFLHLFPGNVMGAEFASIFAIFTSQAWNMTFSFYQSLRTIPHDLHEVCDSFRFSRWQRFWRLEVPFAMPGLIWNMMVSMSGGWFFVVASEAVTVGNTTFTLPGIGSYVAEAIAQKDLHAVGWAILTMLLVILAYDQLLFRPLVVWSEKFRSEQTSGQFTPTSWVLRLFTRTRMLKALSAPFVRLQKWTSVCGIPEVPFSTRPAVRQAADFLWYILIITSVLFAGLKVTQYILDSPLTLEDLWIAFRFGLYTLTRVIVLIILASFIWVPIGVWAGLNPRIAATIQPLAQFLAAFPANLLFPVAVVTIAHFSLTPDIWLSPLMVLGTQWYILFNVIAGTSAIPNDMKEAAANFHIRGWQWWKNVILPGVFPYYFTGAITASGGSWNASIVSEVVTWGNTSFSAHGIGAYIAQATARGDYSRIILGIAIMSFFVICFNQLFWHRLYRFAEERLRMD